MRELLCSNDEGARVARELLCSNDGSGVWSQRRVVRSIAASDGRSRKIAIKFYRLRQSSPKHI